MAFELKDGQGTLFVSDKQGNEKRPDRRGELNIGGVTYELSGWIKQGSKGPWLSLQAKPKEAQAQAAPARQGASVDTDIPFAKRNDGY